jgi:N-methylhydantoinase B
MTVLSPLDYAVISQALIASAREMGVKLIRSAYSTILREARDGSAGLMDRHGNTVAQAELIPMQLGPIGETLRACLRRHPVDTLKEGDFLINNDPFEGGQHIPDVFIFTPIFVAGRIVGFGASVAHHLDLGGGAPGLNIHASDVYQEGIRFPPSTVLRTTGTAAASSAWSPPMCAFPTSPSATSTPSSRRTRSAYCG